MRKFSLTFATALLVLGAATGANAMTMGAPTALRAAIHNTTTTQPVYYWGWRRQYYPRFYIVAQPYYYAPAYYYPRPRIYARPSFYGYGGPRYRRFGPYGP